MDPVRLVLAVQDPLYAEAVLNYVQSSDDATRLQIAAFTRVDALQQYKEKGKQHDLVVLDGAMLEAWRDLELPLIPGRWIYLSDGSMSPVAEHEVAVPKYQPIPELLSGWLARAGRSVHSSHTGRELRSGGTRVLGMVSAIGYCGKTIIAMSIARQLAELGCRVLYLNLEMLNSSEQLLSEERLQGGKSSFSRLLYDLKVLQENGEEIDLEPYIVRKEALKCDGLVGGAEVEEMLEMNADDTAALLGALQGLNRYDMIVVDSDGLNQKLLQAVTRHADELLWVLTADHTGQWKTGKWIQHLGTQEMNGTDFAAKSRFIINRYTPKLDSRKQEITADHVLPMMNSWDSSNLLEQLHTPAFQKEILKLCHELYGTAQPSGAFMDGMRGGGR